MSMSGILRLLLNARSFFGALDACLHQSTIDQPFFFVRAALFFFLAGAEAKRSAVPLWIATCSVLSLLMRNCGDSLEAWCVHRLNFVCDVIFLMMTPLARPASEFQRTGSPTLNVFRILSTSGTTSRRLYPASNLDPRRS